MNSRRPSRYKLITFFVAALTGIYVADLLIPDRSWKNMALAAVVAALVATLMAWLKARRDPPS